jgi:hypothetical protein
LGKRGAAGCKKECLVRISDYQRKIILESAKKLFGDDVQVRLFGSRVDDVKKGGDILCQ